MNCRDAGRPIIIIAFAYSFRTFLAGHVNDFCIAEGGDRRKEEVKKPFVNGEQSSRGVTEDQDDGTRWEQVRARNRTVYSSTVCSALLSSSEFRLLLLSCLAWNESFNVCMTVY